MTEFNNTRWSKRDFAYEYLAAADIQIVERRRLLEILKSFLRHFVLPKQHKRVLDFGCGDGIMVHELLKIDPTIRATLVDGSQDMLDKARERLAGFECVSFVKASFQEILRGDAELPLSDLVISAFAVHHLTAEEKRGLFSCIYSHLDDSGYFVNTDAVLPPTQGLDEWYVALWREWIAERQTALGLTGDYEDMVRRYVEKNHYDKLDTLEDQLDALRDTGFRDVDCFYKYGMFSIYGGMK